MNVYPVLDHVYLLLHVITNVLCLLTQGSHYLAYKKIPGLFQDFPGSQNVFHVSVVAHQC